MLPQNTPDPQSLHYNQHPRILSVGSFKFQDEIRRNYPIELHPQITSQTSNFQNTKQHIENERFDIALLDTNTHEVMTGNVSLQLKNNHPFTQTLLIGEHSPYEIGNLVSGLQAEDYLHTNELNLILFYRIQLHYQLAKKRQREIEKQELIEQQKREEQWRFRAAREIVHDIGNPLLIMHAKCIMLKQLVEKIELEDTTINKAQLIKTINDIQNNADFCFHIAQIGNKTSKENLTPEVIDLKALVLTIEKDLFLDAAWLHICQLDQVSLLGNKYELLRLFQNLIKNAHTACDDENAIIKIDVINDCNKNIFIKITDNGKGITKQQVDDILRKTPNFADTTSPNLGLSICNVITKTYGGRLFIDSTLGKGTQITLQFPHASI